MKKAGLIGGMSWESTVPYYKIINEVIGQQLKELEKIVMIRQLDGVYRLEHAVTATQKTILDAFGLNEGNVRH